MKKFLVCILMCLLVLPSGVVNATTATTTEETTTTESSGGDSGGSTGDWVKYRINQNDFFKSSCTLETVYLIFQNSGLCNDDAYKVPEGTYGGGHDNTKSEFKDPYLNCANIINYNKVSYLGDNYVDLTENTICCNYWAGCSKLFNEHSSGKWENVGGDSTSTKDDGWCFVIGFNNKDLKDMEDDEVVKVFQAFWNNGYWIIAGINHEGVVTGGNGTSGYKGQHWMMVSGVTDDDIYFNDSAGGVINNFKDYYSGGQDIVHVVLLKNDKISLKEAAGGKNAGSGDSGQDIGLTYDQFMGFDENGLASFCTLMEADLTDMIKEADIDNLNNNELVSLDDWKIMTEQESDLVKVLRRCVMIIGILFIVWGILFYCAFWFDRINTYFDLDLLGILSLGRLRRSDTDEECTFRMTDQPKSEARTINHKYCLIISITAIAFGVFMVSGLLFLLVRKIVNFVQGFLH